MKELREIIDRRIASLTADRQESGSLTDYDSGHLDGCMQTLQYIRGLLDNPVIRQN